MKEFNDKFTKNEKQYLLYTSEVKLKQLLFVLIIFYLLFVADYLKIQSII